VIDQDCQLERFQALKLKVFQLKDQTEEYNQLLRQNQSSVSGLVIVNVTIR
jgi:hypothetical protein